MKKLLIVAIVAAAAGGGIVGYHQAQRASQQELSALMLANIEALSTGETGTGGSIPCYSSAVMNYKRAYVDCASCTRIEGWKGDGTEAYCIRK